MSRPSLCRPLPFASTPAIALAMVLGCQDAPTSTSPDFGPAASGLEVARGGQAMPLTANPTALGFLLPDVTPATVQAKVQFVGTITARTSSAQCATVSPLSMPATKPAGSSVYVATFSVTPVGAGACTITLTDKQGKQALVAVHVEAALSERMVFVSRRAANGEVFVREADGTVTQLTEDFVGGSDPAVMPDGRIVFSASGPDHNAEIYIMAADGSSQTRLTFDGSHGPSDRAAAISPDGLTIAFTREEGAGVDIYTMGIDGANAVRLTDGTGLHSGVGFSPDGSRIVFSKLHDGDFEIFSMDSDGSNQTRLTSSDSDDFDAVFAPDGRIVFVSDRDGNPELYRMEADGSSVTRLTNHSAFDRNPAFTRDGRLVFSSHRDGDYEIYLMGLNGVLHPLTDDDATDISPAF